MSIRVRSQDADFSGYTKCYTCDKVFHWKELDCGHFFHGRLDFDLRNLRKQCTSCNRFRHGNHALYAIKLIEELGLEEVKQLEKDSLAKGNNYSTQELEEIIKRYAL